MAGELYLLPVWLGDAGGLERMPPMNVAVAERLTTFFCEDERTARRMLRRLSSTLDLNAISLHRLDKDTSPNDLSSYVDLLKTADAALISEAGMPCIADPGARLVALAHTHHIKVVPLTGPISLMLALAASGLNGQRFIFHGYLPRETAPRRQALLRVEQDARKTGAAQLFIETPYRNDAMLADILVTCQASTLLCIAIDLDQPGGSVTTHSIAQWKRAIPALGKRPCVFIVG